MPGDYFLILRADDGEVFEESDENNNILFSSIKLLAEVENNFSLFPNPVSNNLLSIIRGMKFLNALRYSITLVKQLSLFQN